MIFLSLPLSFSSDAFNECQPKEEYRRTVAFAAPQFDVFFGTVDRTVDNNPVVYLSLFFFVLFAPLDCTSTHSFRANFSSDIF